MTRFAFVVHPIEARDAARRYPILKFFPDSAIEAFMRRRSPTLMGHATGIESLTGAKTEGWFIGLPMTPKMMMDPNRLDETYSRIIECTKMAADFGAEIVGLGAFTSVVGDGGITVAKSSPIAVTTGNSYTVATAIEAVEDAARLLELDVRSSTLAIVGATGSIGKTCARILSEKFSNVILLGRDRERTQLVADELPNAVASDDPKSLLEAHALITVSSAGEAIVFPEHLRPGAIVVDVARPRDVSVRVANERNDVVVIEGGVVQVPGNPDFGFHFGFPPKTAYACMSETMMLALDGRPESFTLGKDVTVEQVLETQRLASKHGFKLTGFRSFERALPQESIDSAKRALHASQPSPAPV